MSQSILEYATLLLIISAAVSALVIYIQRGMRVRVRHLNQELNDAIR
ncbi:MAG: hypothetical protein GF333_07965 [Candidatus Omnitrophica bacterium]|nr:hypothetical protein [Candidatus Omnitrophota bacterium]